MSVKLQSINEIRLYLANELKEIYQKQEISSLANIIIKTVIGVTRLQGFYMSEEKISEVQSERIISICKDLKRGKPIQYIIGETDFFNCIIKVNNATLIPRQETEELVDIIIKENSGFSGKIIDIGTGSGCIAIALARYLPEAIITGVDISDDALKVARENAILNNVSVSFIKEDILNFRYDLNYETNIIVSNPPYVCNSEKLQMSNNVIDYEPHLSLFVPDNDPLKFYKAIINVSEKILTNGGRLYFEINEAMGMNIVQLLEVSGFSEIKIITDINNKERIIKGIKNG